MDVIQKQDRSTVTDDKAKAAKKKRVAGGDKVLSDGSIKERLEKKKRDVDAKKLRRKLQQVAEKNETLAKTLQDKNQEIGSLKRSVQSLNEVLNSVPIEELRCNSSIAGTKILELSKKNRQLRAELETTKNRVTKKEIDIQKLERDLKQAEVKFLQDGELLRKGNYSPLEEMQTKINALRQKLFESRNKSTELGTQLKLAHKCLQQEMGEPVNVNLLAGQALSSWRGRAQQILHLQQKMSELRERLEAYEQHPTCSASRTIAAANAAAAAAAAAEPHSAPPVPGGRPLVKRSSSGSATFDRFSPGVRKSEILHRAKVEALEKEIELLHGQLEDQRSKVLALKVRNKTLNDEILKRKMKACTLVEQTDYNGLNLASMEEKLNMQKNQFENRVEELCRKLSNAERQRDEANYKHEDLRARMDNMEALLASKDDFIMEQNELTQRLEEDLKAMCGGFLFSCRELRKEEFIGILESLETEKNQLLEHKQTLTERCEQERKRYEVASEQVAKQKVRIARLEARIRELEKELDVQTERKRRSQRIADYANSLSGPANLSSNQSVSSFVFENSSVVSLGGGDSRQSLDEECTPALTMELRNQLELATEKITLLEEKVAHLAEEKESDAKTFHEIMANSKTIILDTIRAHKTKPPVHDSPANRAGLI